MTTSQRQLCTALALACLCSGCAAQLTGGAARTTERGTGGVSRFDLSLTRGRDNGVVAGAAARFEHVSAPLHLHAGLARFGYMWRDDYGAGLETVAELGFGEPAQVELADSGFYTGASINGVLPIGRGADGQAVWASNRFYLVNLYLQLVLGADAGIWSMPAEQGAETFFEWAFRGGLRVSIASDAITSYPSDAERDNQGRHER